MAWLRKDPDHIGNSLQELYELTGYERAGLQFSDIDAVTTQSSTGRVLFQELKHEGEEVSYGQWRTLRDLSLLPSVTVWVVRFMDDGSLRLRVMPERCEHPVSRDEYVALLTAWWLAEAA